MTQGYHIAGEIRATTVNNLIVYRMFNGEKWIRLDDPDADRVWDLMGLEPEVRKVTREYYAELDRVAEGSTPSIAPKTP